MPGLITSRATLNGSTRSEQLDGREHLVVPVVALVEGVHNNALHTAEELARFPAGWSGRPFVVNHPERDGQPVSASDPQIEQTQTIGRLFNARFEDGKLKAEAWVDVNKATALGFGSLVRRLQDGETMEVSTGYFSDDEQAGGEFHGNAYEAVRRNIVPDHLALLPDETGACSVADGCGTHLNAERGILNVLRRALGLDAAPATNVSARKIEARLQAALATENPRRNAFVQDVDLDAKTFVYQADQRGGPIDEDPWRHFRRGFELDSDGRVTLANPDAAEEVQRIDAPDFEPVTTNRQHPHEGATAMDRNQTISNLIANKATPWGEDSRKHLEALADQQLKALAGEGDCAGCGEGDDKGNQPPAPATNADEAPAWAKGLMDEVKNLSAKVNARDDEQRQQIVDRIKANKANELGDDELNAMSLETLQKIDRTLSPASYAGRGLPVTNDDDGDMPTPPPVVLAQDQPAEAAA